MRYVVLIGLFLITSGAGAARSKVQISEVMSAANDAFIRSDYDRAIRLYSDMLSRHDLNSVNKEGIFLNRGISYIRSNKIELAISDIRQVLALNPNDTNAARILMSIQNSPKVTQSSLSSASWGPLARLPGKTWLISTTKPIAYVHCEWARVGVSIIFAGKDASGRRLEGQYFLDPIDNVIRVTNDYAGKSLVGDVVVAADQFVETGKGLKGDMTKQISQLRQDGTFDVYFQKFKGAKWQTLGVATQTPTTPEMIASLSWPDQPVEQPSFLKGIGNALKDGAISGFKDGMHDGIHDAVQDKVRKITGTPNRGGISCYSENGQLVQCP